MDLSSFSGLVKTSLHGDNVEAWHKILAEIDAANTLAQLKTLRDISRFDMKQEEMRPTLAPAATTRIGKKMAHTFAAQVASLPGDLGSALILKYFDELISAAQVAREIEKIPGLDKNANLLNALATAHCLWAGMEASQLREIYADELTKYPDPFDKNYQPALS